MITYKNGVGKNVSVFLDGRYVGSIIHNPHGWQYIPKGHKLLGGGAIYPNLDAVKRSLER